ncbi:MAG: lamin tail domain-containing protein [Myxococcota bacterium]
MAVTRSGASASAVSAALIACLVLLACGSEGAPAPQAAPDAGDALGQIAASATAGPTIKILSPFEGQKIPGTPGGNSLSVTVAVSDVTLGPGEHGVRYFVDGAPVLTVDTAAPQTITGFPNGRHHLAVWIVDATGTPVDAPSALASMHVVFSLSCAKANDCNDGRTCSIDSCLTNTCRFGPVADCCDQDLECPFGWHCEANRCIECYEDGDCDDGNPCTEDACGADGICSHAPIAGCCTTLKECDDGDACTNDSCLLDSNTCLNAPTSDPLCCNVDEDCRPADACRLYMCYKAVFSAGGGKRCRFGPPLAGCCTLDAQCADSNPCTLDTCLQPNPADPRGNCIHEPDPGLTECCIVKADCDDNDLSTDDACVANSCVHTPSQTYCALPNPGALVINELMVAPGSVSDTLGEWIEIYNPSATETVNIDGWRITTSLGETFVISQSGVSGGLAGLVVGRRSYFVFGRTTSKSLNGGFIPQGAYGAAISLPDPFETGSPVVHTVRLESPAGVVVDEVTYDSSTWPMVDGRSLELHHPHADNALVSQWSAAGLNPDKLLNRTYGVASLGLYGSPKNRNGSSFQGLPAVECPVPPGAAACAAGVCDERNTCGVSTAAGCCAADSDCNDFNPCTVDACNVGSETCAAPTPVAGCCTANAQCDDGNPCNLDRCISNSCRYSPPVIAGCCANDADCAEEDPCAIPHCNDVTDTCDPSTPANAGGGQCCASDADCSDGLANTDDVCDVAAHLCSFPPNADLCTSAADPCDDSNPCTTDSCDVPNQTCLHAPISGCCTSVGDCTDDGDLCTQTVCNFGSQTCEHQPLAGCCNTAAQCGDGNACTADTCSGHTCHNTAIAGCCATVADCDDGQACTTDSCVGGSCQHVATPSCCNPGDSQATLQGICGADPDGDASCYIWECTAARECGLIEHPECCVTAGDCDDGSLCTTDVCPAATKVCKHLVLAGSGCCATGSDCSPTEYCATTGAQCTPKQPTGTGCTGDDQCTSDLCLGGVCTNPGGPGASCSTHGACASGYCVDGVCCDGACGGACQACDLAGFVGTCTGCAAGGQYCDGGGACQPKLPTGSGCGAAGECSSGVCDSAVCCASDCGAGGYCDSSGTCQPNPTSACQVVVCDPGTPGCTVQPAANGTTCDDGNLCTQTDTCNGGTCVGSNPVVCTASDACHVAGTCFSVTGLCSDPPAPNGISCDDGDLCTTGDSCLNGGCAAGTPVVCTALDECHDAGVCAPGTGVCSNPNKADGTACDIGMECNEGTCEVSTVAPPATATSPLAAGANHTCFVRDDGSLVCWGQNASGQLGLGAMSPVATTPKDVIGLGAAVVSVDAYNLHTCALLDDATMWCWGENGSAQSGNQVPSSPLATPVKALGLGSVTAIGTGQHHSCAVLADSTVRCWGLNTSDQLGGSSDTSSDTPVEAAGLMGAVAVDASDTHTCALLGDGTVECWGNNTYGQAGQASGSTISVPSAVPGITTASQIAVGDDHTCALIAGGAIRCWGNNGSGRLGNDSTTSSAAPVAVSGISGATWVTSGLAFSCAVRADKTVACWGYNNEGQLGDGTTTTRKTPVAVASVTNATAVAAGADYACALLESGDIRCWGNGFHGQLGDGRTEDALAPVTVVDLTDVARCAACNDNNACTQDLCDPGGCLHPALPDGTPCAVGGSCAAGTCVVGSLPRVRLSVGDFQSALRRNDGTVATWGSNSNGQLGTQSLVEPFRTFPDDVPGVTGVHSVSSGRQHVCVTENAGSVRCWGNNGSGQIGQGTTSSSVLAPSTVAGLTDIVDVQSGGFHSCALRSTGQVVCWGYNAFGELGIGTTGNAVTTPQAVPGLSDAVQLSVGANHTCVVRAGGKMSCWGQGGSGRLGNGLSSDTPYPVEVAPGAAGLFYAASVEAGADHTCAVGVDGTVACWGSNLYGALGDGSNSSRKTAVAASGLTGAVAVSSGEQFTCATTGSGGAACWGSNSSGQLGDGLSSSRKLPYVLPSISTAVRVSAGRNVACALLADDSVKCWGANGSGYLGDGTGDDRGLPTSVVGLATYGRCDACDDSNVCTDDVCHPTLGCQHSPAAAGLPCGVGQACNGASACAAGLSPLHRITAGQRHVCVIDDAGAVSCWGRNNSGQLGDGSLIDASSPRAVTLPEAAISISSSRIHTCALLQSGVVNCWGENGQGQLGDGTTTDALTPIAVPGLTGVVSLAAGGSHTCAVRSDGTARCWGRGFSGVLGTGGTADSGSPTAVALLDDAVQITASAESTCAVSSGGIVTCWGTGTSGKLGNASYSTDNLSPRRIAPGTALAFTGSSVVAGATHTCITRANGTAACFGSGSYGHLGTGSTSSANTPVPVSSLTGVKTLQAGLDHTCAVRTNGTLACWGRNSDGQLGNGNTNTVNTPADLASLGTTVIDVATGDGHTCALVTGPSVYCWGNNFYGELGQGTASSTDIKTPTLVPSWP